MRLQLRNAVYAPTLASGLFWLDHVVPNVRARPVSNDHAACAGQVSGKSQLEDDLTASAQVPEAQVTLLDQIPTVIPTLLPPPTETAFTNHRRWGHVLGASVPSIAPSTCQ